MTTEPSFMDRRIRVPVMVTVVLIGVIANVLTDTVANGEFSQWTGYRKWEPYGLFTVYYPMLTCIFRWLVPVVGLGTVAVALRRELRSDYFVWCLCTFAGVVTISVGIGAFMIYGLYSVTHHVLGG